jgi:molybdenum cofactor biosynthesis protein B
MAAHVGEVPATEIPCGIVTVSDTRTAATDQSGAAVRSLLEEKGYPVVLHEIVPDELVAIRAAVTGALERPELRALIVTGGTGIAARDVTVESVATLWARELPGFGEAFRALGFAEIGPKALLSRATAGVIAGKFVALLPGSVAGCRLAMDRLVVPLLGHVTALLATESRGRPST